MYLGSKFTLMKGNSKPSTGPRVPHLPSLDLSCI